MAAACWICLEEGNDGEGKPPVRDCSCRGDAAGYAHNSCIVEYAKVKNKQAKNDAALSEHGKNAPTATSNIRISSGLIWHLLLFRLWRQPTATQAETMIVSSRTRSVVTGVKLWLHFA